MQFYLLGNSNKLHQEKTYLYFVHKMNLSNPFSIITNNNKGDNKDSVLRSGDWPCSNGP